MLRQPYETCWSLTLARLPATFTPLPERDFFIDNLLVRLHFIIEVIWCTGLAPWEFEFPFPCSFTSTFLARGRYCAQSQS